MKIEYETLHRDYKHYLDENSLKEMVAECAYFKAEKRGFTEGSAQQDWLEAEAEIETQCLHWFEEC